MNRVIVIGHGFSSRLGMIRSFGKMGCEVDVVVIAIPNRFGHYRMPIDCRSKYVRKVFFSPSGNREALIELLLKNCVGQDERHVLVPDSDFAASTIDLHQNRLRDYFLFPNINHTPGQIVHWMNKLNQKNLAREVGLNVASGQVIRIVDGEFTIPKTLPYPCFPKPLASAYGGKRGLRKCNDEKELFALLSGFNVKNLDVLVEDYIEINREFAVVGFADRNQVMIPAVIYLADQGKSAHRGVAKHGELLPKEGFEELLGAFETFVRKLQFTGLFDIDFYESRGTFYFGEMNMRYGASGYALFKEGINLPEVLYHSLIGQPENSVSDLSHRSSFMNERVCVDDWFAGCVSFSELRKELDNKEKGFVFEIDDMAPYRCLKKRIVSMIPKREMIRIKNKFHKKI